MSKGEWIKFNSDEKIKYEYEPHSPKPAPSGSKLSWRVCSGCGLIYLNNALTKWCVDKGCGAKYHQDYERKVKELGRG